MNFKFSLRQFTFFASSFGTSTTLTSFNHVFGLFEDRGVYWTKTSWYAICRLGCRLHDGDALSGRLGTKAFVYTAKASRVKISKMIPVRMFYASMSVRRERSLQFIGMQIETKRKFEVGCVEIEERPPRLFLFKKKGLTIARTHDTVPYKMNSPPVEPRWGSLGWNFAWMKWKLLKQMDDSIDSPRHIKQDKNSYRTINI